MQAQLIAGQCRAKFPSLNGQDQRFGIEFIPKNFVASPYIQSCAKGCGRSGYCTRLGLPNKRCGKPEQYAWSMCEE